MTRLDYITADSAGLSSFTSFTSNSHTARLEKYSEIYSHSAPAYEKKLRFKMNYDTHINEI